MSKGFGIFLGCLLVVLWVAGGSSKEEKKPKTEAELRTEQVALAPYACERLGKQRLRDPDSWQKTNAKAVASAPGEVGKYDYSSVVYGRAKNGFGGYTSVTMYCKFNYNSDKVFVEIM